MISFYYCIGPNPMKVALFLEESGVPYDAIPVDILKGEQLSPEFLRLNPNGKLPVLVDEGVTIFDSNAILLYLAEKYGKFLPGESFAARGTLLSWLMFVATGLGPYSGQAVHFQHYAPEPKSYGVQRYVFEARRHYGVLNDHLAYREWMVGDTYTIVDMAVWGWCANIDRVLGVEARQDFPHLMRLVDRIGQRPAALAVHGLRERHAFKMQFDEQARANMFQHLPA
ncbi:glutathione S-transferase family protein [Sphingobium phenoxybenzoativorans]|uniref:glutathione S-transferase family protein n=1 Tax=Sphingobium phenoxybenzoativorans TaxID=1592790 RepID=UPI000872804C|nr:glutathione S-transferase N-terminal domain-containing protein [Sphingobium phenoxybenzoativorans]